MEESKFLVRVCCLTYNHAPYIKDAMNGFCMQETNFPFVCVIMDDASTDGEQEVIKKYLTDHFDLNDKTIVRNEETDDYVLIYARHKKNHNCYFAVFFLKYNHYSIKKSKNTYIEEWEKQVKYIALCEGDDYWTDARKLQKQVDFLESHSDYDLCSHDYIRYYENTQKYDEKSALEDLLRDAKEKGEDYYEINLDNFFKHWFTQPLTCLYRNGDYLYKIPREKYKFYRDDTHFYYILKEGNGALLSDVMGVYRINDTGTWSTISPVQKYKASFYNAHNIYEVEGDERAIYIMKRKGILIAWETIRKFDLKGFFKEVNSYRKLVPIKHFIYYILSLFKFLFIRFVRKIKKMIHIPL